MGRNGRLGMRSKVSRKRGRSARCAGRRCGRERGRRRGGIDAVTAGRPASLSGGGGGSRGGGLREGEGPAQGVYRCGHCGTASKLERRLRRKQAVDIKGEESEATAELVRAIVRETEPEACAAMAKALDQWAHINATLARMLPEVMG